VMMGFDLAVPELPAEVPDMRAPTGQNAICVFGLR